jgi:hypothetical protein
MAIPVIFAAICLLGPALLAARASWGLDRSLPVIVSAWLVVTMGVIAASAAALTLASRLDHEAVLTVSVLLGAAGIADRATRWRIRAAIRRSPTWMLVTWRGCTWWERVGLAALVFVLGFRLLLAVRLPTLDYDGLSYHLVTVDVWLQNHGISEVPQRPWSAGYPEVGEILTAWLVASAGREYLANLTGLVPIPLLLAAAAGLAEYLGASGRARTLVVILAGLTPASFMLAGSSYVDNVSVALVGAAWLFGLSTRSERDWRLALLAALAAGLAIGTKMTNVVLVIPVTIAAAVAARRRPSVILGGAALVVACGVSWYVRNLLVYGNPVYPFSVAGLPGPTDTTAFALLPDSLAGVPSLLRAPASWIWDWALTSYAYNQVPGGFGLAWLLILALAALALVRARVDRRFVVMVVLPAAVTLLIMPMAFYARLTLFIVVAVLPLAAIGLDSLPARLARTTGATLVALAVISLGVATVTSNYPLTANKRGPLDALARAVLDGPERGYQTLGLWKVCRSFGDIPTGSRVVVADFGLPHAVVGPDRRLVLTDPLPVVDDGTLLPALHALHADYLVYRSDGPIASMVRAAGTFPEPGEGCLSSEFVRVPPSG